MFWNIISCLPNLLVNRKGKPFNISVIVIYAPRAQSTGRKYKFYSRLDNTKTQCKLQEITIILGDLNTNVGKEREGEIVGKFGLGMNAAQK